jgi:hypothetical protein
MVSQRRPAIERGGVRDLLSAGDEVIQEKQLSGIRRQPSASAHVSPGSAIGVAFRVVFVAVLFTILGFALGALIGILSVSILRLAAIPVNMQNALWFGALPGGVLGGIAGLVIITISERRTSRI